MSPPRAPVAFLLALTLASSLAAQADDATPSRDKPSYVDPRGIYGFTPPTGWRALTPDEARTLRARGADGFPAELLDPQPPQVVVFGDVGRWLTAPFDGRAILALVKDGEPTLDDDGLAAIRAHFDAMNQQGGQEPIAIDELRVDQAGPRAHPAILATLRAGSGPSQHTRLEAYLPTGGSTVILAMQWPTSDRAAGVKAFAELLAGAHVASAPRGAAKLGNKLMWAALCGLGIGALLHALRKRTTA